jgi:hypothetical protein
VEPEKNDGSAKVFAQGNCGPPGNRIADGGYRKERSRGYRNGERTVLESRALPQRTFLCLKFQESKALPLNLVL